jgi:hypothetical protein
MPCVPNHGTQLCVGGVAGGCNTALQRSISRIKHDLHRRNAQSAHSPAKPACGSRAQQLPRRVHVPMTGRAGHTRLGNTPPVGGGLRGPAAGQMPLNEPKEAPCASLHRRPPESAPEADRPKSAPHASALGRVCQCMSQCDCQCLVRLSDRPAVRRHGVPLHMVVLARSATCVVLSKKTV